MCISSDHPKHSKHIYLKLISIKSIVSKFFNVMITKSSLPAFTNHPTVIKFLTQRIMYYILHVLF